MRDDLDPIIICCAKYLPPMALFFHILFYFFPSKYEHAEDGIYTMLFFGWWAACEVCKGYKKLYDQTHKGDE